MATFGENLRRYRIEQGLTQLALAHKADCEASQVCDYERNANAPRIDMIRRFAAALGVEPHDLLETLVPLSPV